MKFRQCGNGSSDVAIGKAIATKVLSRYGSSEHERAKARDEVAAALGTFMANAEAKGKDARLIKGVFDAAQAATEEATGRMASFREVRLAKAARLATITNPTPTPPPPPKTITTPKPKPKPPPTLKPKTPAPSIKPKETVKFKIEGMKGDFDAEVYQGGIAIADIRPTDAKGQKRSVRGGRNYQVRLMDVHGKPQFMSLGRSLDGVQLGTFKSKEAALRAVERLQEERIDHSIMGRSVSEGVRGKWTQAEVVARGIFHKFKDEE